MYGKFVHHVVEYRDMVWGLIKNSPLRGIVVGIAGTVMGVAKNRYDAFNKLNHQFIDPIVVDFEARYPSSAGLLGHELIDRALVAVWVYYFVKCTLRLLCRKCGACSRKNSSHK